MRSLRSNRSEIRKISRNPEFSRSNRLPATKIHTGAFLAPGVFISVSNFHGNRLGKKFRMNSIPKKVEMRDRSFSSIQYGKRSMLPAVFRNFRFLSSQSTTFSLIYPPLDLNLGHQHFLSEKVLPALEIWNADESLKSMDNGGNHAKLKRVQPQPSPFLGDFVGIIYQTWDLSTIQ